MKKITIVLILVFIITGTYLIVAKLNNNHKLNNAIRFTDKDIKRVWIFEGNHGLSYDYNFDDDIIKEISNQLIQGNKRDIGKLCPSPYSQGFSITTFFNDDNREISFMPRDDNSIFVYIKTKNTNGGLIDWWGLSVESSWMSQFITKVEKALIQ